jgi:hypothetical protein
MNKEKKVIKIKPKMAKKKKEIRDLKLRKLIKYAKSLGW